MDKFPQNLHRDDAADRIANIASYDEARRIAGEPQPDYAEFSVDAIEARLAATKAREAAHADNTELYNLTGPDERTPAEREAQRDINSAGRAAVDAALEAAKANKQP